MPNSQPSQAPTTTSGRNKTVLFICLLIALATLAVYWQVGRNGFINFDDPDYVSANPRVQAGLTSEGFQWAFTAMHSSNWHPVTWLSHMADCQFYGKQPGGHHLTNLALHVIDSLLLFGLLLRMTGGVWRSGMVAALFALHPLHVESVAWIAERKDVLSVFFGLLTLWAYVNYARANSGNTPASSLKTWLWYTLALVWFALGLMSKPMLVTLPCALLLLDYWPLRRFYFAPQSPEGANWFRNAKTPFLVLEKVPFFLLAAGSCVATFAVQKASGAMVPLESAPVDVRLVNSLTSYGAYVFKTFWPTDLAVFYPFHPQDWMSAEALAATLLLLLVTGAALYLARRAPYFCVGWFWFLGTLVPVIGLVQVGQQSMADRYTYLPHIGLFITLVWSAAAAFKLLRLPQWTAFATAAAALVALGVATSREVSYWRDTKTLFERALAVTTRNHIAYTVLSNAVDAEGDLTNAVELCRKALEISPHYPEALNSMGNFQAKQGAYQEAIESYKLAMQYDPTFGGPHTGLGNVYMKLNRLPEAEAECRLALKQDPFSLPTLFCLATALHNQGKFDEAATYYRQVLTLQPDLFTPRRFLGNVLLAQGKADEAVQQFELALKVRPDDPDTHVTLAVAFLQKNELDQATAQFSEAIRLQPTNAIANYQMGLISQSRKQLPQAAAYYKAALAAQPNWPEVLNNLAWLLAAAADPSVRNGTEAVNYAERACTLTQYKEPLLIGTLAAAYAEAGRFKEAVSAAEKARDVAAAAGQKAIADKNSELLQTYRAGKAYHESP